MEQQRFPTVFEVAFARLNALPETAPGTVTLNDPEVPYLTMSIEAVLPEGEAAFITVQRTYEGHAAADPESIQLVTRTFKVCNDGTVHEKLQNEDGLSCYIALESGAQRDLYRAVSDWDVTAPH
jgi:hypothetical protein